MKSISIISLTTALLLSASSFALAQDDAQDGRDICAPSGIQVTLPDLLTAISTVETAQVIRLDGCTGAPDASIIEALQANPAIVRVLEQETVSAGEIISVGSEDGNVTVYVGGDDA